VCSIFFGREAIEGSIYGQIESFIGSDSALQLQQIIKNAAISGENKVAATIGVVMLLIGATTVFAEIQDSINSIWCLKVRPKAEWWLLIKTRLLSFGVIGALGFLLLVSLAVTALVEGLNNRLKEYFPDITVALFYIINLLITFCVVTTLFGVIFKVLPDAKVRWKDVLAGAIATAVLFMLGKFAISFYISKSNVGSTYGTAGSLVILLIWVYYSAIILYFGAEFTKSYAIKYGEPIHPNAYTVIAKSVEVEQGQQTVQQAEKNIKKIEKEVEKEIVKKGMNEKETDDKK
jgi:membrane protein